MQPAASNWTVAKRVSLGMLLSVIQVTYSYAYHDSSELLGTLASQPSFRDKLHMSLFYANSAVPLVGSEPQIKLLCTACSICLLALQLKNDNEGTLATSDPLATLIIGKGSAKTRGLRESTTLRSPGEHLADETSISSLSVALSIALQALAVCRSGIVPVYALLGAAGNFAGSDTAQDIVLNVSPQGPEPRLFACVVERPAIDSLW
jgi:hypothetical protein